MPEPSNAGRSIRRIALLSIHTCPAALPGGFKTGGMNVYVRELSHEFACVGIQVDIFTRLQASCKNHLDLPMDELPNVRLIHINAGPNEAVEPDTLISFVDGFAHVIESFAAEQAIIYDVIYAHYWLSGLAGLTLRTRWQIPLIQMFHTLGLMKDRIDGGLTAAPSIRSLAEARIMAEADQLIAATPAEHRQMSLLYGAPPGHIHVVPPGVDTDRFKPVDQADRIAAKVQIGFAETDSILLFIGRPEPLKAIDTILDALQILFTTATALRESVRLLMIGGRRDEPAVQILMARSAALGLSDQVRFLDAQPQAALARYYHAALALLMPSDYESFGMAALEAMACGTPVIASQVGGLAFLVRNGETGYHIPTRDPAALAAAIMRLVTMPDERTRLAVKASQLARNYQWARVVDQLLVIFETL